MIKHANENITISDDNIDFWLSITGYLPPQNELELDLFEDLYSDYKVINDNFCIDVDEIISGTFKPKSDVISLFNESNLSAISDLKMVARKGADSIPDSILDKMKSKHKKKNED